LIRWLQHLHGDQIAKHVWIGQRTQILPATLFKDHIYPSPFKGTVLPASFKGTHLPAPFKGTILPTLFKHIYLFDLILTNRQMFCFFLFQSSISNSCTDTPLHLRGLLGTRPYLGAGDLYPEFEAAWKYITKNMTGDPNTCCKDVSSLQFMVSRTGHGL
jgi:hypothetical protein